MPTKPTQPEPPPLPGSAASAAAGAEPKADQPTTDRLTTAQLAEANRIARVEQVAAADTRLPTIGRIVEYIAPDTTVRAAIVTYVWEFEEAPPNAAPEQVRKQVNLYILANDQSDPVLRRQTALVQDGAASYVATNVAMQDPKEPRKVHTWRWPVIR
jgi:hypothetical protein